VLSCDDHDEAKRQNGRSKARRTPQAHRPMAWTDDELRAGARNLFAALGLLDNALAALGNQPSSQTGLLAFLRQIDRETPSGKTLHVIASSQAVDMPPATKKWLAGHARVHMHCAPISVPWISSVAWFFSQIDVALLRGSAFANLPELIAAIEDHTAPTDADVQPFTWTRTATVPRSAGARPVAATRLARGSPAGVDSLRDDVTALKRERILQEAARLFFEQGYLQTSVDAIAERLGVTKPFVYYHFNSKVDILVEICERSNRAAVAAAASALSARGSPRVRFEQFLREFTDVVLRDHQMVAIYFREQISLPEKAAKRIDEMRKSIDVRLTALLVEGIHSGEFQIEDPRIGALVIAGMSSFAFAWYREHGRLDQQEVTDRIVRMALKLVSANPYYQAAAYPVASRPHLAADT
jgi:TetR/AcrR family transcriptional regulator, cholesterol catabolism regulator